MVLLYQLTDWDRGIGHNCPFLSSTGGSEARNGTIPRENAPAGSTWDRHNPLWPRLLSPGDSVGGSNKSLVFCRSNRLSGRFRTSHSGVWDAAMAAERTSFDHSPANQKKGDLVSVHLCILVSSPQKPITNMLTGLQPVGSQFPLHILPSDIFSSRRWIQCCRKRHQESTVYCSVFSVCCILGCGYYEDGVLDRFSGSWKRHFHIGSRAPIHPERWYRSIQVPWISSGIGCRARPRHTDPSHHSTGLFRARRYPECDGSGAL